MEELIEEMSKRLPGERKILLEIRDLLKEASGKWNLIDRSRQNELTNGHNVHEEYSLRHCLHYAEEAANEMAAMNAPENGDSFKITIIKIHRSYDYFDGNSWHSTEKFEEFESVGAAELMQLARDYNISEPSALDPRETQNILFQTPNRHPIHGIKTENQLHILRVNGHEPEPKDYQRVADLIGAKFAHPLELEDAKQHDPIYGYYINLDERGDFYADVRDRDGNTVYEVRAGDSLEEDGSSIFDDGFMRHKEDLVGLGRYLRDMGIISKGGELLSMSEFEKRLEEPGDDDDLTA